MFTYKTKLVEIDGKEHCFKRFLSDDTCYSLTISGTTLTEIIDPKIWQDCRVLKIVILLMNNLVELPQKLKEYAASIELVCLQNNNFQIVPSIIFKLTNIKHLNLHGNNISEFPSELRLLENLERLKFGHNCLYSLPDIFSAFKKLIEITFNNNFLTRLPPSFSQLKKLESIDLTNNSFTCIPVQLLKLPNVKSIYMRYNRIHRLSPLEDEGGNSTLQLIKRLITLRLQGNPIFERFLSSLECSKPTLEVISANFAKFEQEPGPIPKAIRVLLLGSCGAGKTCILETLSYGKYVTPTSEMHHDHTVGIDRFSIPVKIYTKDVKESVVELRLWDFAGERSYVMMNKLFVTDDTLIWIAVNFKTYTPADFQEHIGNWIEQIMTKTARPIVWVVATHTDKCTPEDVEAKKESIHQRIMLECEVYRRKLLEERDKLKDSSSENRSQVCVQSTRQNSEQQNSKHLQDSNVPYFIKEKLEVLSVSNTHGAEGFEKLKECINCILPSLCETLSIVQQKSIDKIRHKAEELLSSKKAPIVEKKEVLKIVPELNEEQVKSLLKYLHQVGAVLMYDFHSDTAEVILDVDWLINLLKQIFHHNFEAMMQNKRKSKISFHCLDKDYITEAIHLQKTTGTIEVQVLDALWELNKEAKKQLIKFLECVGLVYEISESDGRYLFPWLAMRKNPYFKLEKPSENNRQSHIMISYKFSPCIPTGFIHELVVKCLKHLLVYIEELYENGFLIYKTYKSTKFSIKALIERDLNSLCGKVYLLVKPNEPFDANTVLVDLWEVTFKIIKLMEKILCSWTFYRNVIRKIRCPFCEENYWNLQLKKSSLATQQTFHCVKCKNDTPPINLIIPPKHLLFEESEFFDAYVHTEEDVQQGVQPTPSQTELSYVDRGLTPVCPIAPQYESNPPPSYEESVDINPTTTGTD